MDANRRCEKCVHWAKLLEPAGNGKCALAEHVSAMMHPVKHQQIDIQYGVAKIDGEYAGQLITHAWFGCVHFE